MTTKLSDYFTLEEMVVSQTASRLNLDNTPPPDVLVNLTNTAHRLDAFRAFLGKPMLISSGYRSPAVNKAVGGAATSAHVKGYAADFICPGYGDPLAVCKAIVASGLAFDQVIEEGTWTHLSLDPRMRRQVLTKRPGGGYQSGLRS